MKNVLLVDDDQLSNFLSKNVLKRIGFDGGIHTALNGKDALDLFNGYHQDSQQLPDIILLDLNMPIIDGFEFLKAFRELDRPGIEKVKIIVITSSEDPDDIEKVKALGVDKYLTKPLQEESLRNAIN